MQRRSHKGLSILLVATFVLPVLAQDNVQSDLAKFIRATYTKHEYQIAMRDGVKLFTSVYVPKDNSQTYPILFDRTPYTVSPYGADNYKTALGPSESFARSLYIFVYQDVRGRMMSEGNFVDMRPYIPHKNGPKDVDENSDAYDTIDWLLKNIPNNNGKVGMWGISYPGFYAAAGMIDAHPALKAVSPQRPSATGSLETTSTTMARSLSSRCLASWAALELLIPNRIMIQVQSSWFPLVDLNPQKFVPNIYMAKPEDFQKATERVYHSMDAPSRIEVLELERQ